MTDLRPYKLEDRYVADSGRAFLSGIQALARIPVDQLRLDAAAGLHTAALLTGYPGSPLATLDREASRAAALANDVDYVVQPGLNEELAAGAVAGSQLASIQPDCKYDGIVGFWYGKTPGLDRASDSIRHGVFTGTAKLGGAVAMVGDDPAAKSSTLPGASQPTLASLGMPTLHPSDVQEVLDLGLHAVAMSRACGLWVALKITTAVADGTSTVRLDQRLPLLSGFTPHERIPDAQLLPPHSVDIEADLLVRRKVALAYAREAKLNSIDVDPPDAWLTIVSSGHALRETYGALARLGLETDDQIATAGIRIVHLRMPFPFDDDLVRDAVGSSDSLLVVEEKDNFIEQRVRAALYGSPNQPPITGKSHPDGRPAIPGHGGLTSEPITIVLRELLAPRDLATTEVEPARRRRIPVSVARQPYFCSGCPHNWGTKVPDGALVGAGIGCHTMALFMDDERVGDITGVGAMGTEGSHWLGMEPFIERDHLFQNIGDGTYFHSGQLAVQAAVAAGSKITYKLLLNGTVAMTGGQDAVGARSSTDIATTLLAKGVERVIITAEDTERYRNVSLPEGVNLWHRDRIVEAQETLARVDGVTVLIHDQHCAAELRRDRHRNPLPDSTKRIAINHRVCEACGDCGDVSNCLSIQPVDTPLGPKMSIDQHSCNLDYSCVGGDCPAFMEITPGAKTAAVSTTAPAVPDPVINPEPEHAIRMIGIGGTGVVTAAQVVATAAMLDGWHVRGLDQTGLAQKGGPVVSDLRLHRHDEPPSNTIGGGEATALIAFDLLGAVSDRVLSACDVEHTACVGSLSHTVAGAMVGHPDILYPDDQVLIDQLAQATDSQRTVNAREAVEVLVGSAATANVFVLGAAVQLGVIPIRPEAVLQALTLNGVSVDANVSALGWGRAWAHDPASVIAQIAASSTRSVVSQVTMEVPALSRHLNKRAHDCAGANGAELLAVLERLTADLVAYQDAAYAQRFLDLVEVAARADATVASGHGLTEAVARGYHHLLAYKDEYEVARLLLGPEGQSEAAAVGGADGTTKWLLHPPMLSAIGMNSKLPVSERLGTPLMKTLRRAKRLRGTRFDPFGRTEVRRIERSLPTDYELAITKATAHLDADRYAAAVNLATAALDVRGYEARKLRSVETFRARLAAYSPTDV